MVNGIVKSRSEFQVNTFTSGVQSQPVLVGLPDGGYLIVWSSRPQDGDSTGIYGQRFGADGTPVDAEFLINTTTESSQETPSVAVLADGGFVVAWSSAGDLDGDYYGNFAQRFDASFDKVGGEFQLNDYFDGLQYATSIGALANGGYVIAWISSGQDGSANGVYAKQFNADGSQVGATEFLVTTETFTNQSTPDVKGLNDGGYLIVWQSDLQDGDNGPGVFAQRFSEAGEKVGAEFQINTYFLKNQNDAEIAVLKDGGFVVTWESRDQDGSDVGIYAQRYDSSATKVGGEFHVSTHTQDAQEDPTIAALPDGGFVIFWMSEDNQDGDSRGIFGQRYNRLGETVGTETQVNTYTSNIQDMPSVDVLEDGSFVVAWSSRFQDGDDRGVYAQHFSARHIGSSQEDKLAGTKFDDDIYGLSRKDKLYGGNGNDRLFGGDGNDKLWGQNGDDILKGGNGADNLNGGAGRDKLYGGSGADHFIFNKSSHSVDSNRADVIFDFEIGIDTVVLRNLSPDTIFIGNDSFSGDGAEIRISESSNGNTYIRIDRDGDGDADMRVQLRSVTGVTEDDLSF